ncbi:hypothetical protein HNY73_019645 [Argiope bruennichi]|uniref:Uncharacterized protein n=1 Tax=Argiope bruennichi TaxID=94029 RepID=A0A8T0E5C4_ARGBR|nr:hypothetical protein HNY73_019645 [Argiope bruennichi]
MKINMKLSLILLIAAVMYVAAEPEPEPEPGHHGDEKVIVIREKGEQKHHHHHKHHHEHTHGFDIPAVEDHEFKNLPEISHGHGLDVGGNSDIEITPHHGDVFQHDLFEGKTSEADASFPEFNSGINHDSFFSAGHGAQEYPTFRSQGLRGDPIFAKLGLSSVDRSGAFVKV